MERWQARGPIATWKVPMFWSHGFNQHRVGDFYSCIWWRRCSFCWTWKTGHSLLQMDALLNIGAALWFVCLWVDGVWFACNFFLVWWRWCFCSSSAAIWKDIASKNLMWQIVPDTSTGKLEIQIWASLKLKCNANKKTINKNRIVATILLFFIGLTARSIYVLLVQLENRVTLFAGNFHLFFWPELFISVDGQFMICLWHFMKPFCVFCGRNWCRFIFVLCPMTTQFCCRFGLVHVDGSSPMFFDQTAGTLCQIWTPEPHSVCLLLGTWFFVLVVEQRVRYIQI